MRLIRSFELVQFCLHVIVENLTRFIACSNVPQKHIDFLLRVYSEEIFKRFRQINRVSEECVLWFLNPYSKNVVLPFVTEKITKQLLIIGPGITSLDLSETFGSEDTTNAIVCCVPNVTFMDLSRTECSNHTLSLIRKECPALLVLELLACRRITDEGLEIFCKGNRTLKRLNLMKTRIKERGLLAVLNEMPQLECLRYDYLPEFLHAMKKDSKLLHSRYSLTEFVYEDDTFGYNVGGDLTMQRLHTCTVLCPNVRKVVMNFEVTKKALEMCGRFENLEYLEITFQECDYDSDEARIYMHYPETIPVRSIHSFNVADNVLASLLPLAGRLTVLKLSEAKICIKLLIEQFHSLKALSLLKVTFSDFGKGDISLKENCLETLVIENVELHLRSNCKSIQLLLSLSKKVTNLRLINLHYLPEGVLDAILNSMKGLSVMDFLYTPITRSSALRFAAVGFKPTQSFLSSNPLARNWCIDEDEDGEDDFPHYSF